MLKGIYKTASGMIPRLKQQEVTANNIANAATPGYKKDSLFMKELSAARRAQIKTQSDWQIPMIDQVYTDYSQGSLRRTDNLFDVAIEGQGFFTVESPEGDLQTYTRNGNFMVDQEGFLVDRDGNRVLGDGGPIEVGSGEVSINENGEVLTNGGSVGRLQIVEFPEKDVLVKVGNAGFAVEEGVESIPASDFAVRQGFLEQANINVIKEMVGMIITLRSFESGAKALQAQDESLRVLINQVGITEI